MASPSPFLAGNFAPVTDETTIAGLPVDGVLPVGLDGQYLRLGPNPAHRPDEPYAWTDTDTMVHAVELRDGRALCYRNRWVLTPHVAGVLGLGPATRDVDACERLVTVGRTVLAVARTGVAYEVSATLATRLVHAPVTVAADRCLADAGHGHAEHPIALGPGRTLRTGAGGLLLARDGNVVEVVDATPQGWVTVGSDPVHHAYAVGLDADRLFATGTVHAHDLARGTRRTFHFGAGRHPGELTFVADDARRGRDRGGWLLGLVHDERRGADDLVVLDTRRPDDGPVATVRLPRRVPYGWHGLWRPR